MSMLRNLEAKLGGWVRGQLLIISFTPDRGAHAIVNDLPVGSVG